MSRGVQGGVGIERNRWVEGRKGVARGPSQSGEGERKALKWVVSIRVAFS
jgi:hypothetical protein